MYKRKLLEHKNSHNAIISSITATMCERCQETDMHSKRLMILSKIVGAKLNLSQVEMDELELLATLHDIGKVGIDHQILNKPDKLSDEEWVEMKKHPEIAEIEKNAGTQFDPEIAKIFVELIYQME